MALHWAWAFNISADITTYLSNGWYTDHTSYCDPNYSGSPLPWHPDAGYGGMTKAVRIGSLHYCRTAVFPAGGLSDGQIQFHVYGGFRNTTGSKWDVLAEDDTVLLSLRPNATSSNPAINVYSGEGSLTLRGTTTATITDGTKNVIGIRLKKGSSGIIQISVNGVVENIVSGGVTGITSDWAKLYFLANTTYMHVSGITVWDDGPGDDALTVTRWVAGLRPYDDDTAGAWAASSGSDLFAMVNEDPLSESNYCYTNSASEMRLKVRTSDLNANWYPETVDGVSVVASMRGDNTLNAGQTVIDNGSNDTGTLRTTTSPSQFYLTNDCYPKQADGSSTWGKTAIDNHTYGVKAS